MRLMPPEVERAISKRSEELFSPAAHEHSEAPTFTVMLDGLTKRELFAAMAMAGLLADSRGDLVGTGWGTFARWAVDAADALLAELGGDKAADIANVELRG
jgi:hypothetical protein